MDQWIETGGSMQASIDVLTRQGAVIAGIATLCIEDGKSGERFRHDYKCATAVLPGTRLQKQCSANSFEAALYRVHSSGECRPHPASVSAPRQDRDPTQPMSTKRRKENSNGQEA